jgi:uncharacterized damage-inducible protein DinB
MPIEFVLRGWGILSRPPTLCNLAEGLLPERPYTKQELGTYLQHCREKCHSILANFTEDQARRVCQYGSLRLTFAELMLYSMRHVQHHAAQLNLLLRQHTGSAPRYAKRAR